MKTIINPSANSRVLRYRHNVPYMSGFFREVILSQRGEVIFTCYGAHRPAEASHSATLGRDSR